MSVRNVRPRRPLVRSVLMATALAAVAAIASPRARPRLVRAPSGTRSRCYAGAGVGTTSVVPEAPAARAARAANITVTYNGFSTAAKASFQRAVNIWKSRLTSGVTVKITANYTNLGNPNILGSAGPTTVHRNFPGAPKRTSGTWPRPPTSGPARTSTVRAWPRSRPTSTAPSRTGTSAPAPRRPTSTTSRPSCSTRSATASAPCRASTSRAAVRWDIVGQNIPLITGTYVVNNANKALTTFANGSAALKTAATSGQVFFNGPQAKAANGGIKPRMFAPNPFQPGSSLSHWDENTYPRGNQHSLMTPFLGQGERILNPGNFTLGALRDSGW